MQETCGKDKGEGIKESNGGLQERHSTVYLTS